MSLFSELKRRNVLRVAAAYLAGAWLLVEVSETLFSIYGLPETAAQIVVTLLVIGLPVTLLLSWVYELTPEGLKLEKNIERTGPPPRTDTRRPPTYQINNSCPASIHIASHHPTIVGPRSKASTHQQSR